MVYFNTIERRIMENISNNPENKKQRGRPKKEHLNNPVLAGIIDQMSPDIRTRRGKNNLYYGVFWGVGEIYDRKKKEHKDPLFKFLFNPEENKFKKTILSALGRVAMEYGPDEAEILAREICSQKMSTQRAVNYINDMRGLGKNKADGAVKKIISVLNNALLSMDEVREVQTRINEVINTYTGINKKAKQ